MSEETITSLKINMAELKQDIKYIKESLDNHISKEEGYQDDLRELFTNFIASCDAKYASKSIENGIFLVLKISLGVLVTGSLGLILKAIIHLQ